MRVAQCSDPCLDPCDPRVDCCCEHLKLESEVIYSTSALPGYSVIDSLVLRWKTPVHQCVLNRAGVESEEDLTFSIYLVCPGSFPATADVEITGVDISAGEVSFTRDELMGTGEPYGACLEDFGIAPCLTVLDGSGQPLLTCYACPNGCDNYPSPPPPSPPPSPPSPPSPACTCVVSVVATASPCDEYFQSFVSVSASVELSDGCDYPDGKVFIAVTGYHDPIPEADPGPGGDGAFQHDWSGHVGCSAGVPIIVIVWFEGFPGQNLAIECGETRIELPTS